VEPLGEALDGVVRVGVDEDGAVDGDVVEGAGDGCELGALVRLALAAEGLGDVSGGRSLVL
jgi:hypothetical protein